MIQNDITICGCGCIHLVRGKDYQEAIEAGKENLLICGNCYSTFAFGADVTEDGYSLYKRRNALSFGTDNDLCTALPTSPDPFYKVYLSLGYPVPMSTGRDANSYFCDEFRDMTHTGEQIVDMKAFIKHTPKHILRMARAYHSSAFDWSGTPYEHQHNDEDDVDSTNKKQRVRKGYNYYD